VAEQAYGSACQNLPTECGITGGRWVCGDRPGGVESPVRRSSSPAAQNPDLVFAAGGTAVWTAVANREANSEQARPDGLPATPRALVVAADTLQSDSPRSGSDGDQRPASAAAVRAGCIGEGRTLLQAEQAYDESCSDPPGGCRTEDLGWICSSEEPEDPQPRP
jgi:hypothetical protein